MELGYPWTSTITPLKIMSSWYFVRTPFPWVCAISFGMGLLFLLEYRRETVNHESLWILGKLTKLLAEQYPTVISFIWYPAAACHIIEALYAFKLAQEKVLFKDSYHSGFRGIGRPHFGVLTSLKIKKLSMACSTCWFAQTICFGFASLYYLKKYEPPKQS